MKEKRKKYFTTILLILTVVFVAVVHKGKCYAFITEWEKEVYKGIDEYEGGKYKESVETLNAVIQKIPKEEKDDLWDAHFYLGMSYYLLNQPEKTKIEFGKASMVIEKLPDSIIHSPKVIRMYKRASGSGNCENHEFVFDKNGKIDRTQPLTILKQDARIYSSSEGASYVSSLKFNKKLKGLEKKDKRIKVSYIRSHEPLGWVDQRDLLCAIKPLKGSSGLERKLYIKTATAVRGNTKAVNAYTSYDQKKCPKEGCREFSISIIGYFIFDEENGRYLLSDKYNFQDTSLLIGWIDKSDVFLWDTAYGLRPKENLIFPAGHPNEGEERALCAYLSLKDAKIKKNCRPILGGNRWYKYSDRIPILGRIGNFYKVALPMVRDILKSDSCKHLGAQCEKKKYDNIIEGYIPVSDDIVEDVWMKADDLAKLRDVLSTLGVVMNGGFSDFDKRKALVIALISTLQLVLADSSSINDNGEPFQEYMKRVSGLPTRNSSPLFQYSFEKLMDKEQVADCEISLLGIWVNNAKTMLDIVSLGTRRPDFKITPYQGKCRRSDGSSISIPYIDGIIGQKELGPTKKYRYDHEIQGTRIYWVPKEYLP